MWFRERLRNSETDESLVHFLGAPLVERDGVPEAAYIRWLKNLIAHYDGKRFVYILHPRESNDWGKKLAQQLNIPVVRQQLPYEIELCMMRKRPQVVASWFCSALDNLGNCGVPNLELVAYRLPKVKLAEDKQRQGKILEAAELFYRRHEGGDKVSVREIPDGKPVVAEVALPSEQPALFVADMALFPPTDALYPQPRPKVVRPRAEVLQQFARSLPVIMVELRIAARGRVLLGHALEEDKVRRLALPMDFWLKNESLDDAARRIASTLLGHEMPVGRCVQVGHNVREVITSNGKSSVQLVYAYELKLPDSLPVANRWGYESFEWWEPATALATPILGAQARSVLASLSAHHEVGGLLSGFSALQMRY
ncbi:hypothetical protein NCCP436_13580 [Pseudomonas sp. NCCP-436]|nr:hypothetical protein NCCP436_13580 [Pseudomonas sp. NCCP-436]